MNSSNKRLCSSSKLSTNDYCTTSLFKVCNAPGIGATRSHKTDKTFKVLLYTDSSSSIISEKVAKYGMDIQKDKGKKVEWKTAAGCFSTNKKRQVVFQLPEFSSKKKIVHNFHVTQDMALNYDMIIGLDVLNELGIIVDFAQKVLTWEGTDVEMLVRANVPTEELRTLLEETVEPHSTRSIRKQALDILDAQYAKANLDDISKEASHLSPDNRSVLLQLLQKYKMLFDGTLGEFKTAPVSIQVKEGEVPTYCRPFPVPVKRRETFRKELERLEKLGVIRKDVDSPCVQLIVLITNTLSVKL